METMETELRIAVRLVVAAVLAGIIGYDRQARGRPAGLRTHILVGVSSCLLVSMADIVLAMSPEHQAARVDPLRVLHAVVAGVSFIGAGTIIRSGADVRGITTAGSLLATTALGAAVAFQLYVLSVAATALLLLVLTGLRPLERAQRSKAEARAIAAEGVPEQAKS